MTEKEEDEELLKQEKESTKDTFATFTKSPL